MMVALCRKFFLCQLGELIFKLIPFSLWHPFDVNVHSIVDMMNFFERVDPNPLATLFRLTASLNVSIHSVFHAVDLLEIIKAKATLLEDEASSIHRVNLACCPLMQDAVDNFAHVGHVNKVPVDSGKLTRVERVRKVVVDFLKQLEHFSVGQIERLIVVRFERFI